MSAEPFKFPETPEECRAYLLRMAQVFEETWPDKLRADIIALRSCADCLSEEGSTEEIVRLNGLLDMAMKREAVLKAEVATLRKARRGETADPQ